MGKSGLIGGNFSPKRGRISPACAARAAAWLQRQHPAKPAVEIEVATGGAVSAETAKKWLAGVSAPSFLGFLALIVAYGPEFLAATLDDPPGWLSAAALGKQLAALETEQGRLDAAMKALGESRG